MKKYFTTYADDRYSESRERIKKEAENLGIFDKVFAFKPDDLSERLKNSRIMKYEKGGGYWIWKPYIVKKTLEQMSDGDILVYIDSGCSLFPSKEWNRYFKILEKKDFVIFKITRKCGPYTKRSLLEFFNKRIGPFWKHYYHIASGIIFLKKTDFSVSLIDEWEKLCTEENLIDVREEEKGEQFPDFVDHRHDQSVFAGVVYCHENGPIKILPQDFEGRRIGQAIWASRFLNGGQKHGMSPRSNFRFHLTRPIRIFFENITYSYWKLKNKLFINKT